MIYTTEVQKLKRNKRLIELYKPFTPKGKINSNRFGKIEYLEWLTNEGESILARNPKRIVRIGLYKKGTVSLWVDDIGDSGPFQSFRNKQRKIVDPNLTQHENDNDSA